MTIQTSRPRPGATVPRRPQHAPATRRRFLLVATAALAAGPARPAPAAEPGFPAAITADVGGRPARLVLTGSALRTKYLLRVYTVASYVQEGVAVRSPEALANLDAPKLLLLHFERDVDGATMGASFRDSIGRGHPAPAFARELAALERHFVANPVKAGDRIALTHVPAAGLGVRVNDRPPVLIPSVPFAQAAWGTYFGPHHLGVALKESLSARLR